MLRGFSGAGKTCSFVEVNQRGIQRINANGLQNYA
jgi:hypothetical protein